MFLGTPSWAVPSLCALLDAGVEVTAVVTNPDRPAGRGLRRRPTPVKLAAAEAGIEVLQPERARDPALGARLHDLEVDVGVVVAYGAILPPELLAIPPHGFVNLHFSLLPAWRGAAPVQRALMSGARETGVSVIVLTEGMDEGPVLESAAVAIDSEETAGELGERLARLGAPLLVSTLRRYVEGEVVARPQDHPRATYAPRVTPAEARVDWTRPAGAIHDHVRALNPAPGAWTILRGERLKVWRVRPMTGPQTLAPGVLACAGEGLAAGAGKGAVALLEVQPAARKRMSGPGLGRGLRLRPGERLE